MGVAWRRGRHGLQLLTDRRWISRAVREVRHLQAGPSTHGALAGACFHGALCAAVARGWEAVLPARLSDAGDLMEAIQSFEAESSETGDSRRTLGRYGMVRSALQPEFGALAPERAVVVVSSETGVPAEESRDLLGLSRSTELSSHPTRWTASRATRSTAGAQSARLREPAARSHGGLQRSAPGLSARRAKRSASSSL